MRELIKVERNFGITKSLDESGIFEGYASVFDVEDAHGDSVAKGAFKAHLDKLIKEKRKVKMLWHHDRYQPIGVYKEVEEDGKGLRFQGQLTLGVQKADETRLLMLAEAVDSVSIGGYVTQARNLDKLGLRRELQVIELNEISPVTFPALDAARIDVVKSVAAVESLADLETFLCDTGGYSLKTARTIIAKAKGCASLRDAGDGAISKDALDTIRNAINSITDTR